MLHAETKSTETPGATYAQTEACHAGHIWMSMGKTTIHMHMCICTYSWCTSEPQACSSCWSTYTIGSKQWALAVAKNNHVHTQIICEMFEESHLRRKRDVIQNSHVAHTSSHEGVGPYKNIKRINGADSRTFCSYRAALTTRWFQNIMQARESSHTRTGWVAWYTLALGMQKTTHVTTGKLESKQWS